MSYPPSGTHPWIALRDYVAQFEANGDQWTAPELCLLVTALVAELRALDTIADVVATRQGSYCGDARGVLMALSEEA